MYGSIQQYRRLAFATNGSAAGANDSTNGRIQTNGMHFRTKRG